MSNPSKQLFFRFALRRIQSRSSSSSSSVLPSCFSNNSPTTPIRNISSSSSSLSNTSELWRRLSFRGAAAKSLFSANGSVGDPGRLVLGTRFFGSNNWSVGIDFNTVKSLAAKPVAAVASVASKNQRAAGLQLEAFWKRNYLVVVGAFGLGLCIILWRIMFGIASTFVGLSEGMAKYGFLALAAATVSFAGLYVRSRFTLNPDKIYRIAMRKLNTSAGILEIMGAPLAGTDVRAYVMSGGGPRLKNFKLKVGGKRCFLIFPIQGSERKGLVSVETKKKKGEYDIKMLAVDIPMASGPDQRIFLVGDEKEYTVGGGLISVLRDPIVKAMAAEKEFEELDEKEEAEEAEMELEGERKRLEEYEKFKEVHK